MPQDDCLHGFYTCHSYLKHYARLAGMPTPDAEIDKLLVDLGLKEQRDTIVGDLFLKGLSGGQKRRLSIALEALTHPQNLFLGKLSLRAPFICPGRDFSHFWHCSPVPR